MTVQTDAVQADQALKAKHRAMWGLGDYPAVAAQIIPELGTVLVDACDVRPGQQVLDVAAGTGNAAIPAARAGAHVVASDLTPDLLDVGRRIAHAQGVQIRWDEGDAEALPYEDSSFDTVISCVGVMFTPHHQAAADELVRVGRPGGTIGLVSWTPEGFIGEMFKVMKPYAPPPPPGAQPPPLWGSESHVRELLGDRVTDLVATRQSVRVDRFESPEEFRDYFKTNYGPTLAAYRAVGDDAERVAALDRDLADLARRHGLGSGKRALEWEYLLVTARKAATS